MALRGPGVGQPADDTGTAATAQPSTFTGPAIDWKQLMAGGAEGLLRLPADILDQMGQAPGMPGGAPAALAAPIIDPVIHRLARAAGGAIAPQPTRTDVGGQLARTVGRVAAPFVVPAAGEGLAGLMDMPLSVEAPGLSGADASLARRIAGRRYGVGGYTNEELGGELEKTTQQLAQLTGDHPLNQSGIEGYSNPLQATELTAYRNALVKEAQSRGLPGFELPTPGPRDVKITTPRSMLANQQGRVRLFQNPDDALAGTGIKAAEYKGPKDSDPMQYRTRAFELPSGDVAHVVYAPLGNTLRVGYIGSSGAEGSLGPKQLAAIRDYLLSENPGVTKITGDRVSGVRVASGAGAAEANVPVASPRARFSEVSPEDFNAAVQQFSAARPDEAGFLTHRTPEQMRAEGMRTFLSPDGKTGYALHPASGDIRNVFNHGERGAGSLAVQDAIKNGGSILDAYDTRLTDIYRKLGFMETGRMPWDDAYRPEGWNEAKYGKPDVVNMEYHPAPDTPVAQWSRKDLEAHGQKYGVRGLGGEELPPQQVTLKDGRQVQIPSLQKNGRYSLYDLAQLKAQGINPNLLPDGMHEQIHQNMMRTYTQDGRASDPVDLFRGLLFGITSPNSPLTANEYTVARMMPRSMGDIQKLAAMDPESVPEHFGIQAGAKGGLGTRGSVDYSNVTNLARLFSKNPEWFQRGANEPWDAYTDRISTQVPGLGTKTAALGGVFHDIPNANTSAVDRHMITDAWPELMQDKALMKDFSPRVLMSWNNPDLDAYPRVRKPVKSLAAMLKQPGGDRFARDFMQGVATEPLKGMYQTSKGTYGKNVTDALKGTDFIEKPDAVNVMNPYYRKIVNLAAAKKPEGMSVFGNQWFRWDKIRGRIEPHAVIAYPDLHKLPPQAFEDVQASLKAHSAAGYTAPANPKTPRAVGAALPPVKPVANPSSLLLWGLSPLAAATAASAGSRR